MFEGDAFDHSEVIVAIVGETGHCIPFSMAEQRHLPEGATYLDTVTSSVKAAVMRARAEARRFSGSVYVATLPEFNRTDNDDTFDMDKPEEGYVVTFPFRLYLIHECEGGTC
jgi:hypothetical protein